MKIETYLFLPIAWHKTYNGRYSCAIHDTWLFSLFKMPSAEVILPSPQAVCTIVEHFIFSERFFWQLVKDYLPAISNY